MCECYSPEDSINNIIFIRDPFRGGNNILVMCECYSPDDSINNIIFIRDPFRGGNNILVMCECYSPDDSINNIIFIRDPFRGGNNILVMCECYSPDDSPHPTNRRYECNELMKRCKDQIPWLDKHETVIVNYSIYCFDIVARSYDSPGYSFLLDIVSGQWGHFE